MSKPWSRLDDPEIAVARILEGADKAFAEVGVSKAGMATIAEYAGCSRGTLYRYFETRHELHIGYIEHVSTEIRSRIEARVRSIRDPRERLAQTILCAVREVRARPGAAAWFAPGVSGTTARMSRSAEVVEAIAPSFLGDLTTDATALPSRFVERIILSLLANPGDSEAEERALVERFVVPGLLAGAGGAKAKRR